VRDEDTAKILAAVGLGGLVLVAAYWRREIISVGASAAATVADFVGRGARLTDAPAGADGVVYVSPEELAAIAGGVMGRAVTADAYALARMIRSEGADEGYLRAHVALNDLRHLGWSSLVYLMTFSTNPSARGWFGAQWTAATAAPGGITSVRRYATSRDPYQADLVAAEQALAERAAGFDPTDGAEKFVDRSSFGAQSGTGSYAALVERWGKEGLVPGSVAGASDDFVVFRRV
jgi:hypothetical protein